jgi:hypothetical protein
MERTAEEKAAGDEGHDEHAFAPRYSYSKELGLLPMRQMNGRKASSQPVDSESEKEARIAFHLFPGRRIGLGAKSVCPCMMLRRAFGWRSFNPCIRCVATASVTGMKWR